MDISIRPVTADDLDAVVNIVIKAFPYDEQFAYRYPYREKYPEEHYKYTKMYYAEYLKTTFAGQNTIMVAEAPDLENPEKTKVIALSIWDNPGNREPNPDIPAVAPPKNHPERKDCSPARLKAYSEATMKARKEIFVGRFGERQLSLRQMATLPDYWRRGAASKLLTWGMERARNEDVAVTMFAGRMGNQLYSKFGFKELGRVKVQVPGETEFIYEIAMAWDLHEEVAKSVLHNYVTRVFYGMWPFLSDLASFFKGGPKYGSQEWYKVTGRDSRWVAVDEWAFAQTHNEGRIPSNEVLAKAFKHQQESGLPDISVSPSQGKYIQVQAKIANAQHILEVGTLGGYSTIFLANANPTTLVTSIESVPLHVKVARENLDMAGLGHRVEVIHGNGVEVLPALLEDVRQGRREKFDFVFIDADKLNG